jgi:hypothetical protein
LARGSPPDWIIASQNWLFGVDKGAGALRLTLRPGLVCRLRTECILRRDLATGLHVKAVARSTGRTQTHQEEGPDGHCLDLNVIARATRS